MVKEAAKRQKEIQKDLDVQLQRGQDQLREAEHRNQVALALLAGSGSQVPHLHGGGQPASTSEPVGMPHEEEEAQEEEARRREEEEGGEEEDVEPTCVEEYQRAKAGRTPQVKRASRAKQDAQSKAQQRTAALAALQKQGVEGEAEDLFVSTTGVSYFLATEEFKPSGEFDQPVELGWAVHWKDGMYRCFGPGMVATTGSIPLLVLFAEKSRNSINIRCVNQAGKLFGPQLGKVQAWNKPKPAWVSSEFLREHQDARNCEDTCKEVSDAKSTWTSSSRDICCLFLFFVVIFEQFTASFSYTQSCTEAWSTAGHGGFTSEDTAQGDRCEYIRCCSHTMQSAFIAACSTKRSRIGTGA